MRFGGRLARRKLSEAFDYWKAVFVRIALDQAVDRISFQFAYPSVVLEKQNSDQLPLRCSPPKIANQPPAESPPQRSTFRNFEPNRRAPTGACAYSSNALNLRQERPGLFGAVFKNPAEQFVFIGFQRPRW